MFEGHESAATVVSLVVRGDLEKLMRLVERGCRVDRRIARRPWLTPLDAAATRGDVACAALLLDAGAPLAGSSILGAIEADSREVLELFQSRDPHFYRQFASDGSVGENAAHKHWIFSYSALDYALSCEARACEAFLAEIGAPKAASARRCAKGHYAPLIDRPRFLGFGGTCAEGMFEREQGFCCDRCGEFDPIRPGAR